MDLFLQFGYAMRPTAVELCRKWQGGSVILSPRDIPPDKCKGVSSDIKEAGGKVLLDPQFYLPHADHKTLCKHVYWPADYDTSDFWSGADLVELLRRLEALNDDLDTDAFILPGLYAEEIEDVWEECHNNVISAAASIIAEKKTYATVALSYKVLIDDSQIEELLAAVESWEVDGIYLVCEHPPNQYFVSDTNWIANLLNLVASFKLSAKKVILGYANQQMLIAACSSADAIASGTWRNVRSFNPEKFNTADPDEVKTKAIWYYSPNVLSEYKVTFLDVAFRQGVLDLLKPSPIYGSKFADKLFQPGIRPSTFPLKEPESFRHFLQCLRAQALAARLDSFESTVKAHENMLDIAESLLTELQHAGVRGQGRDFYEIIDVNRAALAILETTHGPMLRHRWNDLS